MTRKPIDQLKKDFAKTYTPSDSYQRSRSYLLNDRELPMEEKLKGFAEIDNADDARQFCLETKYIQDHLILDDMTIIIRGDQKAIFDDQWRIFFEQQKQIVKGRTWTEAKADLPVRSLPLYGETYGLWTWTDAQGREISTEIHAGKVTKIGLDGWAIVDMDRW